MSGSTLIMAPALGLDQVSPTTLSRTDPRSRTTVTTFEVPSFDFDHSFDTTLFLDGKDAALTVMEKEPPVVLARPVGERTKNAMRHSLVERPKSWLASSKSATNIRDFLAERPSMDNNWDRDNKENNDPRDSPTKSSVTESFASFRRKSFISLSLPSSPTDFREHSSGPVTPPPAPNKLRKTPAGDAVKAPGVASSRKRAMSALEPSSTLPQADDVSRERSQTMTAKASTYLEKIKPKQHAVFGKLANDSDTSRSSSSTSLTLPGTTTFTVEHQGNFKTASFADSSATSLESEEMAPQRDPLWNIFKNLELEGKRLYEYNTPHRVILVRTHLMSFLRASASEQSSAKNLHPDDLDRRATILDIWWKNLIDMIDGRGLQPLAGTERPLILEAATLIMERPEWRQATTCFLPLNERSPTERVKAWKSSSSSSSLTSEQESFLIDSAEHNVRNMFVGNLTAQMHLVVGKLSMNHAPLSLVSFCAKACAYAFFFAPGVADVLVRLWNTAPDHITRAADELGLSRRDGGESEDIVALFPPNLASVGWSCARDASDRLRIVPRLPMGVASIQWYFPRWLTRWRGYETDLFYIFTKYFFILAEEFMPAGLPLVEKARSPAFVLVQAQMLAILESTIRQPGLGSLDNLSLYNSAYGPDAAMSPGLARSGLARGMPENLLLVLLQNFLGDSTYRSRPARHTFAESFQAVLRAGVKRTSLFAANACHSLCDVLEEVLCAYGQYDDDEGQRPGSSYIDWSLMLDVARKLSGSLNVNTDIRLLSFIYMSWDTITADPKRKEALVLDWLLTEEVFDKYFNNWSPMVRAYFMRLLCWRICWDLGRANELDTKIFMTVAARLKTNWSHYTYLKLVAERAGRMPPTTAACPPAPGKIFAIRTVELNTPQPGLFLSFDQLNRGAAGNMPESPADTSPSKQLMNNNKKRWSLLGKVLTLSNTPTGPDSPRSATSPEDALEAARRESALFRTKPSSALPPPPPPKPSSSASHAASDDTSSTDSNPVYADPNRIWRFELENWFYPPPHARERPILRPRLPAPAQARVSARSRSGSNPPPPAARMPAPTRRVSGLKEGGLVNGARNASPGGGMASPRMSTETAPQLSFSPSFVRTLSEPLDGISPSISEASMVTAASTGSASSSGTGAATGATPVQPKGVWASNARYSGRALAEWAFVVAECNAFVERRREEGVLGLSEIEVPKLVTQGPPQARG